MSAAITMVAIARKRAPTKHLFAVGAALAAIARKRAPTEHWSDE